MLAMIMALLMVHSCCSISVTAFAPNIAIPRTKSVSGKRSRSPAPLKNRLSIFEKRLSMSSEATDPNDGPSRDDNNDTGSVTTTPTEKKNRGWVDELRETSPFFQAFLPKAERKIPPLLVEDNPLLLYDILLILNLTASISFWVVHRMSFDYIAPAISEGSLMCILWIISGLFNGAFLYSAVDGHYNPSDDRAGPKAAGMLGLHTFINTASLRVILALVTAIVEHRPVGAVPGEDLVPLEIAFGLVLMSLWRLLHSSFTPRI
jgi:hypothetical protein